MLFCGLVSLALTIVNIICIIGTGWAILRIKEVTPERVPQRFSRFWTNDVKVHRTCLQKGNTDLLDEAREAMGIDESESYELEVERYALLFDTLFERVEQDDDYINILEWGKSFSPASLGHDTSSIEDQQDVDIDELTKKNTQMNAASALVRRNTVTTGKGNNNHFREVARKIQLNKRLRQENRKSFKQGIINQRIQNEVEVIRKLPVAKQDDWWIGRTTR